MRDSHTLLHKLRFALASVAVLVIGCLLRLEPWQAGAGPAAQTSVTATPVAAGETASSMPANLVLTILGFYDKVDRGLYAEAYEVSLENKWELQPDGSYKHAGLVSKQEFVDTLTGEFGANGVSIRLDSIQFEGATPLPLPDAPTTNPPEYAVLGHLPDGLKLTSLYAVQMHGSLGDSCTPLPWWKKVIVAGTSDGQFKVLLPGGPRPGSIHKNEWFSDKDPFGGSQLVDEEASS